MVTVCCCAQYTKVRVNAMYRSMEYLLPPVTVQDIVPPRRKKNEHTPDNLRGKCPMIFPVFFFFTVSAYIYRSIDLERCAAHTLLQQLPLTSLYIHLSRECNNLLRTPPR